MNDLSVPRPRSFAKRAAVALLGAGLMVGLAFSGVFGLAAEEPAYKLVLKDAAFEIRDYPALVVAEVTVPGSQKEAANRGFRLLAGYIFGGNRTRQSIAMTAPVAQVPTSESIAMTAPVAQTEMAGQWLVRFTMPRQYTLASLPQPTDARVHLHETAPIRFAVIRFSGVATPAVVGARTAGLSRWLTQRGLHPSATSTLAQYDPPWTLWFMRRNEVMIAITP